MKNLKTLAYQVKPIIPESNSLAVVNDKLYYFDENNNEFEIGSDGEAVTWDDVQDKPTTFPPTIGATATTAKAGDYQPTWAQVGGKPTTFAPAAHGHPFTEITGTATVGQIPTLDISKISGLQTELDNKLDAVDALEIGSTADTAKAGNYVPTWSEVTSKPATFPPTIGTTATTAKAGDYVPGWAEVTGKPTAFTPSAHTHAWADITDKPAVIASGATQAEARTAIGAGTGNSNLAIGTTASTAKAGNYSPSATEVVAALNAMTPEQIEEIQTLLGITTV